MKNRPTEVFLNTNKPFFLERNDCFWVVASNSVEIYYIKSDKGLIRSARHYLYTAKKGDILFSLMTDDSVGDGCLIAVSSDSKLIQVHKSFIGNLSKKHLSQKIDRWINSLSDSLHLGNQPKNYKDLDKNQLVELKNGEIAYPTKGVLWGAIKEGSASIYGNKNQTENKESAKNILIPISKHLRLEANSDDLKLDIFDSGTLVYDDITLMLSIHHVQVHFLARVEESYNAKVEKERAAIYQKYESDQSSLINGLSALKGIVNATETEHSFVDVDRENKLLGACQIIGKASGFDFNKPKFIRDYEHNLTGQLTAIAQVSNVRVRKVILRGRWWEEDNGHLLAFTREGNTPVALIQSRANEYNLRNVEESSKLEVNEEVAKTLEPVAYMFLYAFDKPMTSISKIGKFAFRGLKLDSTYIILAALAGSLIGLLTPILSGVLFDDVIPQADRSFLFEVIGIMLVIGIVKALLNLVRGILLLRIETKSNVSIQAGLMDHLLRLPVTFFRKYSSGDLTMRALGINSIRQILSNTILTTVLSGAFSVVNLLLLFYYDAGLAWIGVLLALAAVVTITTLGLMKLQYDRKISDEQGALQGILFEFLSSISKIRVSGAERRFFSLWANKFGRFKALGFGSGSIQNWVEVFTSSYPLLTNVFFFGFIYFTLQQSTGSQNALISVGVFMAFISAFNQFLNDCLSISMSLISSLNIVPLYERLKPILEEQPESLSESGDPGELSGDIEFNNVSFRYEKEQPLILKDVDFKIKAGEMVAFVGPSGSGKSTVLRLLLGFEEAEQGSIFYDKQLFDTLNRDLVRQQIGVVLQNGALMSGSIFENIVGNTELTLEDAEAAARMAGLEEDIKQMPMGMHTVVSEGGSTFSGGQRQRLMIARAIVHKPRIIFMDEATSALDNHTQKIVSDSLDKLQATRIVIAHRLSTIVNADRIYVMDKGEIVESGTYNELIKNNGLFSTLAKRQVA